MARIPPGDGRVLHRDGAPLKRGAREGEGRRWYERAMAGGCVSKGWQKSMRCRKQIEAHPYKREI